MDGKKFQEILESHDTRHINQENIDDIYFRDFEIIYLKILYRFFITPLDSHILRDLNKQNKNYVNRSK